MPALHSQHYIASSSDYARPWTGLTLPSIAHRPSKKQETKARLVRLTQLTARCSLGARAELNVPSLDRCPAILRPIDAPWPAKRDPLLLKRRSPQLNQHRTLTRPQDAFIKPAPSCPSPTICDSCAHGNGISICVCISMPAPPYPRPTAGQGAHHGVLSALFAWSPGRAICTQPNPGTSPHRRLFARQIPAYAVYVQRQHQRSSIHRPRWSHWRTYGGTGEGKQRADSSQIG